MRHTIITLCLPLAAIAGNAPADISYSLMYADVSNSIDLAISYWDAKEFKACLKEMNRVGLRISYLQSCDTVSAPIKFADRDINFIKTIHAALIASSLEKSGEYQESNVARLIYEFYYSKLSFVKSNDSSPTPDAFIIKVKGAIKAIRNNPQQPNATTQKPTNNGIFDAKTKK